jgi:hypothetical protein
VVLPLQRLFEPLRAIAKTELSLHGLDPRNSGTMCAGGSNPPLRQILVTSSSIEGCWFPSENNPT